MFCGLAFVIFGKKPLKCLHDEKRVWHYRLSFICFKGLNIISSHLMLIQEAFN